MTFLGLQNQVTYWLDDLQFGYFTTVQVKVWLNNAQKEVQKRLVRAGQNHYLKCVQTTLIVNQNDYVLPEDFKELNRLEIILSGTAPNEAKVTLTPITNNQQDLVGGGSGTPQYYFLKRNRIVLIPAPSSAVLMRMDYTYQVAEMVNDTDLPDVPDAYTELIALLAAEDGHIKDDRSAPLLVKKIDVYQRDLDIAANNRLKDAPRRIVETGDGYGGMDW